MSPGDAVQVAIHDLDGDGAGVGAAIDEPGGARDHLAAAGAVTAALETRVPGALPGELVSACIDHVSPHRPVAWAILRTIDRASPARVLPVCPGYGPCGGCVLQHFAYPAQLGWKEERFRAQVAAHPTLGAVPVAPAVPSPRTLGYRNKSKLVAGRDAAGRLILGAYAPRTHDVIDLAGCRVIEPPLDAVAGTLREALAAHEVAPYDEARLTGTLRYVILRASARGEVLATLVTAGDDFAQGAAIARALRARHPEVAGVVQNLNPTRGNALYGARQVTLAGAATLEDRIGDVRLQVSSQAFLQANRQVAEAAYRALAAAVRPSSGERVIDAFAGVGGIALTLASGCAEVIGIEEHPAAVDDAVASARLNGVTNARFIVGDAARRLAEQTRAEIVVLNPPRKGCARAVLDATAALGPRVIAYLSCSPETLLRDLAILHELGYHTRALTPFDMLPHTPHLEALAILDRA